MHITDIQILFFIIVLLISGGFAAFTGGLFGVGGGATLVPILVTIFPYFGATPQTDMKLSITTSLALIAPSAIRATKKQYQLGNLDLGILKFWSITITIGVIAGIIISRFFSSHLLKIIFNVYLYVMVISYLFKKTEDTGGHVHKNKILISCGGFLTGGLSTLLGIGGGTFAVPFFAYLNFPLKRAIALGSASGIFIGFFGAIGGIINGWDTANRLPYSLGYVSLPAFFLILPTMMYFMPIGSTVSHKLSPKLLKILYILYFLGLAIYMSFALFYR